jgi:hypothetical protein
MNTRSLMTTLAVCAVLSGCTEEREVPAEAVQDATTTASDSAGEAADAAAPAADAAAETQSGSDTMPAADGASRDMPTGGGNGDGDLDGSDGKL